MVEITADERTFLRLLSARHPTRRKDLPLADRKQDRVRQSVKRKGLARFIGGWLNGQNWPMGWQLTEAGSRALSPTNTNTGE